MRECQIYAAGAMSGLTVPQQTEWREDLAEMIANVTNCRWTVFCPTQHVSDFAEFQMSDREMMDYDIYHLLRSDLVIMSFEFNAKSVGTIAEMGIAYSHHIPILGYNPENAILHPWQRDMCSTIFTDWNKMVTYLVRHYLNEK